MSSYIYDSMRPYQRDGARFLRNAGSALLTDQPGLGKTIQALGSIIAVVATEDKIETARNLGAVALGDDVTRVRWHLVVTPKVAIRNVWEPEVARWLIDHATETLCLTGTLAERQAALVALQPRPETRHVFVIVNIESMRVIAVPDTYKKSLRSTLREIIRFSVQKDGRKTKMAYHPENGVLPGLLDRVWDTVICDESHRALIRTDHIPTQTRAGFVLVKARRRLALSGTPMRGKPEQLWGTLNWLRPDLYTSYWNWLKLYFEVGQDIYSRYIVGGLTPSGEKRLARDLAGIMLRRTKAEVAPELPAKTYAGYHLIEGDSASPLGVWLEMDKDQRKQYDRLIVEGLIGNSPVNGVLASYTRARQVAGGYCDTIDVGEKIRLSVDIEHSPKFDWLVQWLAENVDEKVVVVSQYTDTVLVPFEIGLKAIGYEVVSITGRTGDRKRTEAVEAFQHGSAQVMLLNVKAGGVALTLDSADYAVFLDETSIPDDQEQAEDRIHRISRNHNVTIYYLRMLDTIEEEVAFIAAARQDVQQYLLDGARGVEYARSVYLMSRSALQENPTEKEKANA